MASTDPWIDLGTALDAFIKRAGQHDRIEARWFAAGPASTFRELFLRVHRTCGMTLPLDGLMTPEEMDEAATHRLHEIAGAQAGFAEEQRRLEVEAETIRRARDGADYHAAKRDDGAE